MERFTLVRQEDPTGISGTGTIAEGVRSTNGKCVLFWLTECASIGIYDNIDELMTIHGHEGKTVLHWVDSFIFDPRGKSGLEVTRARIEARIKDLLNFVQEVIP